MAQNFNVSPYYDDFDASKNFHRILFKPGYAVQARELTQAQTILQNQISNFADAIFTQNTPVTGGKLSTNMRCYYLKLNTTYNNNAVVAQNFLNQVITDDNGVIFAKVVATTEATAADPPTLIVSYVSGIHFSDNMTLTTVGASTYKATTIGTTGHTTCTGASAVVSISTGVFYVVNGYSKSSTQNPDGTYSNFSIGNFVQVNPQTTILSKYSSTPSVRVGLQINETVYDYINDASLLDPAVGASNYQAPGADRYVITLDLITLPLTPGNDSTFIELMRIENGDIVKQTDSTVYSVIDDYFAKRDYETNGDYVVNDFPLVTSSNFIYPNSDNIGFSPVADGDPAKYDLKIGKGIAYVHGYRLENKSQIRLTGNRARDTASQRQSVFVDYGNYFVVDNLKGSFNTTALTNVDFHCVAPSSINTANATTYSSTLVGTGKIRYLDYVSSTGACTASYIFNAHVCDVGLNNISATVQSATSSNVRFSDTNGHISSVANAYYGATVSILSGAAIGETKKIVSYNGTTKTATLDSVFINTVSASDKVQIIFSTAHVESIVQKNTGVYTIKNSATINAGEGKLNGIATGDTILQDQGHPELIFKLGNQWVADANTANYYSTIIYRNKGFGVGNRLQVSAPTGVNFQGPPGTGIYGETFKQLYTLIDTSTGNILDFTYAGNTATVGANANTVTFTSAEYSSITSGIDVYAQVWAYNADDSSISKIKTFVVNSNTTVESVSTFSSVTSNTKISLSPSDSSPKGQVIIAGSNITRDPMSLYTTDVVSITKVLDTRDKNITPSGSFSSYLDITGSFILNNGQKDNYYDHATIQLKQGAALPQGQILVVYNYYKHSGSGDGYFDVNSYSNDVYLKIPTYTAKDGTTYNLRDCIDFRPSRQNAQTDYVWEYHSGSPSQYGILIPNNLSSFQTIYSYYLARKDKLVLTKDNKFLLVEGTSSLNPEYPTEPASSLLLAKLTHDPYTGFVPGETPSVLKSNLSIEKVVHKRWAKSDISDLQKQVDNLEYYTSLSLLEQKAQSLQVPDVNGLNRFKNGILVDDFSSFGTADSSNPEYNANINIRTQKMGPIHDVQNFQLQNPAVMASVGKLRPSTQYAVSSLGGTATNIFSLPYTSANLVSQKLASNTVSVNPFSVVNEQGILTMNPPIDNWVNSNQPTAITINDPNLQFNQVTGGLNLTNAGDYKALPGTAKNTDTKVATLTSEQAYASQTTGLTLASSSTKSVALTSKNAGVVNNTAVLPNIRAQEIIIRAKGLKVNTPVHCWFDGKNVDQYMTQPSAMELVNVQGIFNADDIIGFYAPNSGIFYPFGRVIGIFYYPNDNTKCRLYVAKTMNPPDFVATQKIVNAVFDETGAYLPSGTTGLADIVGDVTSFISIHTEGSVTGIGGSMKTVDEPSVPNLFKSPKQSNWGAFSNLYGTWGDQNNGANYNAKYRFEVPAALNNTQFTIKFSCYGNATVNVDNVVIGTVDKTSVGEGKETIVYANLTSGTHNVSWTATHTNLAQGADKAGGSSGFALQITDNNQNVIWNTLTPTGIEYFNVNTAYKMPDGGILYDGANTVTLDSNASSTDGYYVDCKIAIKYSYTYQYNYGVSYFPPFTPVGGFDYPAFTYPPFSGDGDGARWNAYNANKAAAQAAYDAAYAAAYNQFEDSAAAKYKAEAAATQAKQKTQSVILCANGTKYSNIYQYDGDTRTAYLTTRLNVSQGISSQYGDLTSHYSITGTIANLKTALAGGGVPTLSTDEHGEFTAVFHCPGSVFFTGERVFRVDNREMATPNDPNSATTYAEGTFYASGVQIGLQAGSFQYSKDAGARTLTPTIQDTQTLTGNVPAHVDPIAQTFIIKKANYPNGAFLRSIKLFFAPYPSGTQPTVPVTVCVVGTINGYPSGQILDHSTVTLPARKVNTSTTPHYLDPTTWTEFVFPAPVYIQPDILYAFLVESNSSEYIVYYGGQNQIAVSSTVTAQPGQTANTVTKIGAAPYVGALFESQNGMTWTADQTKDLMFTIDKCVFDITKTPKLQFVVPQRLPHRKLGGEDLYHKFNPDIVSNLRGIFSPSVAYDAFNVTTTDFAIAGTTIDYEYRTMRYSDRTFTDSKAVTPGKYGMPLSEDIYLDDGNGERLLHNQSNNSFTLYATLSSTDPNISPVISDDGVSLFTVKYHINNMGVDSNYISIVDGGENYSQNTSLIMSNPDIGTNIGAYSASVNTTTGIIETITCIDPGEGYITTPTITVVDPSSRIGTGNVTTTSSSNVVTGNGTSFTTQMKVGSNLVTTGNVTLGTIQTITNNISLILTTDAQSIVTANNYYTNYKNAVLDVHGSTSKGGGNGYTKYFTKKVVMTPGNDSGDMRVYCTAYKPLSGDIYVYYKILNSNDTEKFDDQNWQLMTQVGPQNVYSKDKNNYIEYEYAPGIWGSGKADNYISYTSTSGLVYNSFIQFAVKIVLASSDSTSVPFIRDLRALALPSGTGI